MGSMVNPSNQRHSIQFTQKNSGLNDDDPITILKKRLTDLEIETSTVHNDKEAIQLQLSKAESKITLLEKETKLLRSENLGLRSLLDDMRDEFKLFKTEVTNEITELRKTGSSKGRLNSNPPSISHFGKRLIRENMLNLTHADSDPSVSPNKDDKTHDFSKLLNDSPCFSPFPDSATFGNRSAAFDKSPVNLQQPNSSELKLVETPHFLYPNLEELQKSGGMPSTGLGESKLVDSRKSMKKSNKKEEEEIINSKRAQMKSEQIFKPEKLFENLLIIGPTKEIANDTLRLSSINGLSKNNLEAEYEGKVVFNYAQNAQIPEDVTPGGIEKYLTTAGLLLKECIATGNEADQIFGSRVFQKRKKFKKKFVCSFLPHTNDILLSKWDKNVQTFNPQNRLYAVCIKTKDYLIIKGNDRYKFLYMDTVYCLLTYYPIFNLAFKMLSLILTTARLKRWDIYLKSKNKAPELDRRVQVDFESMNEMLLNDARNYLNYLFECAAPKPSTSIKYNFKDKDGWIDTIEHTFPEESSAYLEGAMRNSSKVFERFGLEDIKLIVSALLLDRPVIFSSSDIKVLTATLNCFLGLIAPFKYVYEIVSSLPAEREGLLGAPRPIVICVNRGEDYFDQEKLETYNDKIFVFIDSKIIYKNERDPDIAQFPILDILTEDLLLYYQILNPTGSCFDVITRIDALFAKFLVNPPTFEDKEEKKQRERLNPKNMEKAKIKKESIQVIFRYFKDFLEMNIARNIPIFVSCDFDKPNEKEIEILINTRIENKNLREFFHSYRQSQGFLCVLEELKPVKDPE